MPGSKRPNDRHACSNGVIWAVELGVKADANPGVDNIAYVNARHAGFFQIRCAELCGLWHGHMAKKGRVLTGPAFQAAQVQVALPDRFLILGPLVSLVGGNGGPFGTITLRATTTMRLETVTATTGS